ncbi:MAG TPA: hypothetical protein VM899_11370, partial [Rubellimicrobium sp.]|nr:hypothetical protein [Rubellimicrobium sp.]
RDLSGIRRSLQLLMPGREPVRSYLERPDPDLDGVSPLTLMLVGGHVAIVRVRHHLAARVASLP